MSATLIARQTVSDYKAWRKVYNDADTIRARHGCTSESVLRSPKNHNLVFITHPVPNGGAGGSLHRGPVTDTEGQMLLHVVCLLKSETGDGDTS